MQDSFYCQEGWRVLKAKYGAAEDRIFYLQNNTLILGGEDQTAAEGLWQHIKYHVDSTL